MADRNARTQGPNDANAFLQSAADPDVFGAEVTPDYETNAFFLVSAHLGTGLQLTDEPVP